LTESTENTINERLRSWLDGLSDTYDQISDKTGIGRSTLFEITKPGKDIKHTYLLKLEEVYNLNIPKLFKSSENNTGGYPEYDKTDLPKVEESRIDIPFKKKSLRDHMEKIETINLGESIDQFFQSMEAIREIKRDIVEDPDLDKAEKNHLLVEIRDRIKEKARGL
jgi:transcriptional regulator with XRE-family HTH domain